KPRLRCQRGDHRLAQPAERGRRHPRDRHARAARGGRGQPPHRNPRRARARRLSQPQKRGACAMTSEPIARSRLRAADWLPTATIGLRARKLRAALSALAVAVGIAAVVSVLGITTSSESALLASIDRLGTNLLTVVNGQS